MRVIKFLLIILTLTSYSIAQSPGGVATGLVGWYRANSGVTLAGSQVSTWLDNAGTAQNATQTTAASRPTYNSTSRPVNFNPYIRYDLNNDSFNIATNTDMNNFTSDQRSLIIAFRTPAVVSSGTAMMIYEEGSDTIGMNMYIVNSTLYMAAWNNTASGTGAPWTIKSVNTGVSGSTNYIASLILEGNTTITGQLRGYLNGSLIGTATNVGRRYAIGGTNSLGRRNGNTRLHTAAITAGSTLPYGAAIGAPDTATGDINEVIYYKSTAISNTDRNKVESYLATKYGITLSQVIPTNYVNAAGTIIYNSSGSHSIYNSDIAGIGIDNTSVLSQPQSRSVNADDILTIGSASAMANNEFLMWGNNNDDNGVVAEISTGVPGTVTRRLDRVWRADQEGDVGTVTVSFNLTGIAVTGTTAADFALLVDTADSDFTSGSKLIAATSFASNIVTFTGVDFTGDDYFTLATKIVQPVVTISLSPSRIGESGAVTSATLTTNLNGPWHSNVTVNFSYSGSATSGGVDFTSTANIIITAGNVSNNFVINAVDDAFAEGSENNLIQVTSVVNGTESGIQQALLTITDNEIVGNACLDSEQIFSTELTSGDVNVYSTLGTFEATSTSAYNNNYEMIIDPDNSYRYLSSYGGQKITRADLDGNNEIVLWDTTGTNPFQIAIDQGNNKIYWTDWSDVANIKCANLDGTGTVTTIASGLYYPTGMQVDKVSNSLYVYFGFSTPVALQKATLDGNCGAITLNNVANSGLNLAYNLSIDPPGNRLFFVDYNANTVSKINTNGTGLVANLWSASSPGDQLRDIIYNKNTNQLYWIYTNGVIQRANADGTGAVTTVVDTLTAQTDSRSIDMCVDSVAPRLVSFTSTSSNGTYCPGSTINITATYDETLGAGSTVTVILDNGASVVLNNRVGATVSGTYTVGATGSGQDSSDLTVSSISSESIIDAYSNTRTNSTVPISPNNIADTKNIVVDTTAPTLTEITPVPNPTINRNPSYTFSSPNAGAITYGGSCRSSTTTASVGNNTITLGSLPSSGAFPDGIYSNCSLTVFDAPSCNAGTLNISSFEVAGTLPTVTLSIDNSSIAENGGTATVTATLSNTYALPTTVNFSFSGTASNGTDYSSTASVVIPALSTTATMLITGINDLVAEGNETIVVDISSVVNGTESGVQQVTTNIIDSIGSKLVSLSVNNLTILENGGTATFTATLNVLSASTVTVDLGFSGVATILSDYSASSSTITIPPGSLTGSIVVTAIDDPDYEVDESVIVDILSVTNAVENGVQQRTTNIRDDQTCNYNPMATPSGLTAYMGITIDSSFDPNAAYIPEDGDSFDTIVMGRNPAQKVAWRAQAVNYFLTKYGVDFTSGNTANSNNVVLVHGSYDARYNTRLNAASGYRLIPDGGSVRAGYYAMIVVGNSTTLTGTWGGAGTYVPYGTIAEFGEYAIDVTQPCSDFVDETDEITTTRYLAYQSTVPNLADFISYNGSLFIDIPETFEHDLRAGDGVHTYIYTTGKVHGRKELRQINNNLVKTYGNIIVTVP